MRPTDYTFLEQFLSTFLNVAGYFISCFVLLCFTLNISDLGFTKFTIIIFISTGRGEDKNTKPILTLPQGAGTKYCPIPTQTPLWGKENAHKAGGVGQGQIAIPTWVSCADYPRERERERKTLSQQSTKKNKEKRGHVRMKNA